MGDLETVRLDFVLVRVRTAPFSVSLSLLAEVIEMATGAEATVDTVFYSIVFAYFGAPIRDPSAEKHRRDLVAQISESAGSQVAVIHGQRDWPVGVYGSDERHTYGAATPELPELLRQILDSDLGQVVEV